MIRLAHAATFSIAFFALLTGATAQNIYRCGDSYSQSPCPGGVTVEAHDGRTTAQQAQAAATVQRERQAADALEKSRLKEEAAAARGAQPANAARMPTAKPLRPAHKSTAKKRKEPAYFTAKASGDKQALKKKKGADATAADAPR